MPVTITATPQDSWPPRVLVTVNGLSTTSGDLTPVTAVTVYRQVGARREQVRGGYRKVPTDPALVVVDAELPFGVPVRYVAVLDAGATEVATNPATYALPGGQVALTDALTGAAAEVVVMTWPERAWDRDATVYSVGGRNVVVSGPMGQPTSTLEVFTDSTVGRDALVDLLATATAGVVQIRQPGGYDGVDGYLAVLGATERRWSQDGTDPRRVTVLRVAETEPWTLTVEARGYTLADVAAVYDAAGPNLVPNPTVEANATGYAVVGGTVTRTTAQAHQGVASLLLTPNGTTASPEARTDQVTVVGGRLYRCVTWQRVGSARLAGVGVVWYNAANAIIGSTVQQADLIDNTWTRNAIDVVAPTDAVKARLLTGVLTGTPPASSVLYMDDTEFGVARSTLADVAATYGTLLQLAQGTFE